MQALGIIIMTLMISCDIIVSGSMMFGDYAVKSQAGVQHSLVESVQCGVKCNENVNCVGFFIGGQGACYLFEHGQPLITVDGKGTYNQKLPEEMPTLYKPDTQDPKTCLDVKIRDGALDSSVLYTIDPDGDGGEDPIDVSCSTPNQSTIMTAIGHDRRGNNAWRGPQADKITAQSYSFDITYDANHAQLHTLAVNSKACSMYADFKCKRIPFNSYRWVSYDGSWNPMNVGTTHCPPEVADVVCACSHHWGPDYWAYDNGFFNDKSKFPVTAIIIGGLATNINYFVILDLGEMTCVETPTCTRAPTLLFATRNTPEVMGDVSYNHGDQVVYTCFSGLHYPDGTTQKMITCEKNQIWSGLMYTECVE